MKYKKNWAETQEKFRNYWQHRNTGRPLMDVVARKPELEPYVRGEKPAFPGGVWQGPFYWLPEELRWTSMADKYMDAARIVERYRFFCEHHEFLGESYPNLSAEFGPGSVAAYLGSNIEFREDTIWFEKCFDTWEGVPELSFDPESYWYKKHFDLLKKCRELAGDDFPVNIPDLMENVDVLASLRGANDLLYDMIDEPEEIERRIAEITEAYFNIYDGFYDVVKSRDGSSSYTCFQIWGDGKTAKLQCDFSALLSPQYFRDFVLDSLREQAKKLDNTLYHLDGPDAIKHLDALMEIEEIDALQWTSGDDGPDGTCKDWYVIYDKARTAGKSLWIKVYTGGVDDWIQNVDRIVRRYGSHSLFLMFPDMAMADAEKLMAFAERNWCDIEGEFKGKV